MGNWWEGVAEDFSGLPAASEVVRVVVRLFVAAGLGGLLGIDRERLHKEAGLRTHMLVALGAALFVIVPRQAGFDDEGLSRIIQGLLAGLGFIGAGAILKLNEQERVKGLTTASTVWLAAAFGVAAGLGRMLTAMFGTALALLILCGLRRVEARMHKTGEAGPQDETHNGPTRRRRAAKR
ncbi:MAG: MgtC/SapB family protein [Planctomycetes bacterium]|nr:MgtC/SapB family protein [Planctomycetota bacterium]